MIKSLKQLNSKIPYAHKYKLDTLYNSCATFNYFFRYNHGISDTNMSDPINIEDTLFRKAAFEHIERLNLKYDKRLPMQALREGFLFRKENIHLVSGRGIHKPRQMDLPLTITTIHNSPYEDSFTDDKRFISYKYQGTDPQARDNNLMREVYKRKLPLIYFHGLEKGVYMALWPVFIIADSPQTLTFTVACDDAKYLIENKFDNTAEDNSEIRRQYVTSTQRVRLHQGIFRERVLKAYRHQCTLCRLKHVSLLDAAHIIPDNDDRGEPKITNGLSLCKIHHTAYDKNIIGINTDYKAIVREDILEEVDGPMLKHGIQQMNGQKIHLPRAEEHKPDLDFLQERFEAFKNAV